MAVSKRKIVEADAPAEEPTPKKSGPDKRFVVMLGNDCQRYLLMKTNELFLAGKKYSVSEKKRKELFTEHADENGIRYFYDAEIIEMQMLAAKRKGKRYAESQGETDAGEDYNEPEGVITLKDDAGEAVGKKGDSVSI